MDYRKFFENLSEKEKKMLYKSHKEKEEILNLASDGCNSLVSSGGKNFKPGIMLLAHSTTASNICIGTIGDKQIILGEQLDEKDFMRIMIDSREQDDIRHYFHYKEQTVRYDNGSEQCNDLLIAYVESSEFAQLCLFDGLLQYKISDIFVMSNTLRTQVRIIAFSYLKRLFPELDTTLPELLSLGGEV